MDDCLFCKIFSKKIPSDIVFENNRVIGFKDINPQAKIHLLFIHKNHTSNMNELIRKDPNDLIELMKAIEDYTTKEGLEKKNYRMVSNIGSDAGQSVFHTHIHILSGEKLGRFGK